MKTKLQFFAIAVLAFALSGCVIQCINPLFTEKDYLEYSALVGTWAQKDDDKEIGEWTFSRQEKYYLLNHKDEHGRAAIFRVAVGKLGPNVFLDGFPEDVTPGRELNDFMSVHLIPAHTFVKVVKTNDSLWLVAMNVEWLQQHLKEKPNEVAHILREKMPPVITATTEDLKKFVAKYADDTNAFQNVLQLVPKNARK